MSVVVCFVCRICYGLDKVLIEKLVRYAVLHQECDFAGHAWPYGAVHRACESRLRTLARAVYIRHDFI